MYYPPGKALTHNCKLYLKKLAVRVESLVKSSYIYTAVNINLDGQFHHLFTFSYISSAGWFQRSWVYVCRNFHTPRWASRFSAFGPSNSSIYFFTHKSCGL